MNILTNGGQFTHADVDPAGGRLVFEIPAHSTPSERHWWGRLEQGDEVSAPGSPSPVELLDESFRVVSGDLRERTCRIRRSGVVHLRVHGPGGVELRVDRRAFRPGPTNLSASRARALALAGLVLFTAFALVVAG